MKLLKKRNRRDIDRWITMLQKAIDEYNKTSTKLAKIEKDMIDAKNAGQKQYKVIIDDELEIFNGNKFKFAINQTIQLKNVADFSQKIRVKFDQPKLVEELEWYRKSRYKIKLIEDHNQKDTQTLVAQKDVVKALGLEDLAINIVLDGVVEVTDTGIFDKKTIKPKKPSFPTQIL